MKKQLYTLSILLIAIICFSRTSAQNANTSLSNLVSVTKINHNLIPGPNNKLSLGTSTKGWLNLYLTNSLYLNNQKFISNSNTFSTCVGFLSGGFLTRGTGNTAFGYSSLYNDSIGNNNTAIGYNALYENHFGAENTAVGKDALSNNDGYDNVAIGNEALFYNINGIYNTALGFRALYFNVSGTENTSVGMFSMFNNAGSYNTAIGYNTLSETTVAQNNTAVGYAAGARFDNGYNNIFVGANADVNDVGMYNVVVIGKGTIGTASSSVTLGNPSTISCRTYADWSTFSDGRAKKNIKQNVPGLAFINKLQPVTYNLDLNTIDKIIQYARKDSAGKTIQYDKFEEKARNEKEKIVYTGFIAQDVEKAAKSLNYDFSGVDAAKNDKDLYGLRYASFVVPLVKAVQELSQQNDSLKNELDELKKIVTTQLIKEKVNQPVTIKQSALGSLKQNKPNPFSNSTTIDYMLPQQCTSAQIIITDKNGIVLKKINIGGIGENKVEIDASTFTAGIYQYSLLIDENLVDSKQMVLTK